MLDIQSKLYVTDIGI